MSRNAQSSGQIRLCLILQHENRAVASIVRNSSPNPTRGGRVCDLWQRNHSAGTWFEGYGISMRTDALDDFVGDKRKTLGGVAGFGARLAPGVNIGFSVDQSRTDIDVPLATQSATLNLTRFGFNGSIDKGP